MRADGILSEAIGDLAQVKILIDKALKLYGFIVNNTNTFSLEIVEKINELKLKLN